MLWLVNIVAYIINAVVVGGSTAGWWGATNDTVSDDNPTLVTPDSWAFSIWGLIFLGELVFIIWQALSSNRNSEVVTEGVSCWFAMACILQAVWSILFAQEELVASAVVLVLIAFSLAMAVIGLAPFKAEKSTLCLSVPFWTVHFPIGLHGGWVLAASLVNINVALNRPNLSLEVAALVLTVVGACLGATIAAVIFRDQVYLLAITWALAAIASKEKYRKEVLGAEIADGVREALTGLWIGLIVVGVISVFSGMMSSQSANGEELGRPARSTERKQRNRPSATSRGGHQSDLTSAIYTA